MKDDPYLAKKLRVSLPTKDGGVLRTVRDVDAYLEALPNTRRLQVHWQHAKRLLLRGGFNWSAQHLLILLDEGGGRW